MRLLLIAPSFFGFRDRVATELAKMGHKVKAVNDRPSESTLFKSVAKLDYRFTDRQIDAYADILSELVRDGGYDRVVYLGGMSFCFTYDQFLRIRRSSNASFTAYLWDSFANCSRFAECMGLFDTVLSFEPIDCERHELHFRPLFYSEECSRASLEPKGGFDYDACFIGSVHQPSKFEKIHGICTRLEEMGLRVYKHYFMPSKSVEMLRKMTDSVYRGVAFRLDGMSETQVADVYARSRVVIDSPQSDQVGLTMRTLEALGAQRKLITTNPDIAFYDFYNCSNVFVSTCGSVPDASFFKGDFNPVPSEVRARYSIRGFCEALLGYEGTDVRYRKAG